MPPFQYQGRNAEGKKVSGTIETYSTNDVVAFLKVHNIIPISITKAKKKYKLSTILQITYSKIRNADLMNFCRQMATLISAGVPMLDALKQLATSSPSQSLATVLGKVYQGVVSGKNFSLAIKEHPKIFSPLFVSIVEAGENTGHLNEAFSQLATYLEVSITNRRRLATTVRYPISVIIAIIVAITVMNILVIPKFKDIFSYFSATLPLPTRILIGTSNFITGYWLYLIIIVIGIVILIPRLLRIPRIHYFWDKYKLNIPIFGAIQKRIILTQFTWTLSMILKSGVPIIKGMTLASTSTGNAYFTEQILLIRDSLEQGTSFYQATIDSKLFPAIVLQMISIGEETGKLDSLLDEISKYYEREIDYDIKRLNDTIEPIMLAFVGGMVLLLALGIYLPMWNLIKVVKM